MSEAQVVQQIATFMDNNADGVYEPSELVVGFSHALNLPCK